MSSTSSIELVANASPFASASVASNTSTVVGPACWLHMLVALTTARTVVEPAGQGGAMHEAPSKPSEEEHHQEVEPSAGVRKDERIAHRDRTAVEVGDPSPEPSPQTADHLIAAWGDNDVANTTAAAKPSLSSPTTANGRTLPMSRGALAGPRSLRYAATKRQQAASPTTQRRSVSSTPLSFRSSPQQEEGDHSSNDLASSSFMLARRAIAAQKSRDATLREQAFWANRLRLLRRELEEAETSASSAHESVLRSGASQAEDAIRQQLEDEQAREAKTRAERLAANRQQREAHARALRDAHRASLSSKRSICQQRRQETSEAAVFVEEQHSRELHRRTLLKEAVQQEKVVQVLVRARTRALKMEETRRLYEQRVQLLQDEDALLQQSTAKLIQENSRYVRKLRMLKEERQQHQEV